MKKGISKEQIKNIIQKADFEKINFTQFLQKTNKIIQHQLKTTLLSPQTKEKIKQFTKELFTTIQLYTKNIQHLQQDLDENTFTTFDEEAFETEKQKEAERAKTNISYLIDREENEIIEEIFQELDTAS